MKGTKAGNKAPKQTHDPEYWKRGQRLPPSRGSAILSKKGAKGGSLDSICGKRED